jgi:hypothetical protein
MLSHQNIFCQEKYDFCHENHFFLPLASALGEGGGVADGGGLP